MEHFLILLVLLEYPLLFLDLLYWEGVNSGMRSRLFIHLRASK